MAFKRRTPSKMPPGLGALADLCVRRLFWFLTRVVLTVTAAVVLAGVLLTLRLMQGPLEIPALGDLVAQRLNAQSDDVRVSTRTMVLTLGEGRVPSGLEFRDVEVVSLDGDRLFSIPRVGTSFNLRDLVHGQIRPVRFSIIEADAQFIRARDGRIRFGLGSSAGIALGAEQGGDAAGLDAVSQIIDSFVGDIEPIEELTRLERIEILGANLVYTDRQHGGYWATRDADLRIWRNDQGAQALLTVDDIRPDGRGAAVRVRASRRPGERMTVLRASFGRLDTSELARQLPGLSWLDALGATLEGAMSAEIDDSGRTHAFRGEVVAERGRIGGPDGFPFRQIMARFQLDPDAGQMQVDHARVVTDRIDTEFSGVAGLAWTEGAELPIASAQIDIAALRVVDPKAFAAPLEFDRGQIAIRWLPSDQRVELAKGWIGHKDLTLRVDGQISTEKDAVVDLRAEAPLITARQLEALWPLDAAPNARKWFATNILKADITDLVIQTRLGPGEPIVEFDFAYQNLDSTYIKGMSPIREARGQAHLNYHELHLVMDEGHVQTTPETRLDLAGSRMAITDFNGAVTPADIDLIATGPTAAVLSLINEKPLSLVDKLGIDLGPVAGQARVTAKLKFPLIDALRVDQIYADARATLSSVRMGFPVSGQTLDVAARKLDLAVDTKGLKLEGRASLDGMPVTVSWREDFRGNSRQLDLAGTLTPDLMARLRGDDVPFDGTAPYRLALTQAGRAPMGFDLNADLEQVSLSIAPLGWTKRKGSRGTLRVQGVFGTEIAIEKLTLDTASLSAEGQLKIIDGMVDARFSRLRWPGKLDVAAHIRAGRDQAPEVWLTGSLLDIQDRLNTVGDADQRDTSPFTMRLDVRELRVSDKISLRPAKGSVSRGQDATVRGDLQGRLGGVAAVAAEFNLPAEGQGKLKLSAADAGQALEAADLYREATGGTLVLNATLGGPDGADLAGQLRIDGIRVRSKSTFSRVLRAGGLEEAEDVVTQSGIAFGKIVVPFSYADGIVTLTDAIAVSPMLGLKLNGTLDEDSEQLDMIGVMSPAYALTGALNNVPVLGQIFAGGEGEGILAMTFTLKGQMRDPNFSVNPLSLLTPGFLRRLFTHRSNDGDGATDRSLNRASQTGNDR